MKDLIPLSLKDYVDICDLTCFMLDGIYKN